MAVAGLNVMMDMKYLGQRKEVLGLLMSMYDVISLPGAAGPEDRKGAISVVRELGNGECE